MMSALGARVRRVASPWRLTGLALVAAGAAIVLAPLPSRVGCPAPAYALTQTPHATAFAGRQPAEPTGLARAEARKRAADAAIAALDDVDDAVAVKQQAADTADRKASRAENAAEEAQYASTPIEDDPDMAQFDVDDAQSAVDSAQDMLDFDTQMAQDAKDGGYYDSYYQDEIDSDEQDLADAQKDLAAAEANLETVKGKAAASDAQKEALKATAKSLRSAAKDLQASADEAGSGAERQRELAEEELSSAQDEVWSLEAEHTAAMNRWSHAKAQDALAARAVAAEHEACRTLGLRDGGAAVALAATGVLALLPWRAFSRMTMPHLRRRRPRLRLRRR